jgi:hypothetical protein
MTQEKDPSGKNQHEVGAKLDAGKLQAWLMFNDFGNAITAVAEVVTKGAIKYSPSGWKHVENGQVRYMDAFARHTLALARGEQIDPDTGCPHKAHMVWNLLAVLELELREKPELESLKCPQNIRH